MKLILFNFQKKREHIMPEIHEIFESEEELVLANRLRDMKDHGNTYFKNGDYEKALNTYIQWWQLTRLNWYFEMKISPINNN